MILEFGEWLPDRAAHGNPGSTQAKNCLPNIASYQSLPSLAPYSTALTAACLGNFWMQGSDDTYYQFCGDTGKLYLLSADTWGDKSKVGGYSATHWEFVKFGFRCIAVSITDSTQYFDVGTSSIFADLAGSPPKAHHVAVIRDFVVYGNVNDGTARPSRVVWSGYNDSELNTPSLSTQSDFQELHGRGGKVQRIIGGTDGIVFQEHSIWRMSYVGSPQVFQFDEIERGRGTDAPDSVVWTGNMVFYKGHDGFYAFNGQSSTPIGNERVDAWFEKNADQSVITSMRGAIDPKNKYVFWAFKSTSSATTNNRLLIYHWGSDRWSYAEVDTEVISSTASAGYSLDALDAVLADIDSESIPVDSPAYKGGVIALVAFDSSHKASTFSGTALTAELETTELSQPDFSKTFTTEMRPLIDTDGTISMCVGHRDQQHDNITYDTALSMNSIGSFNTMTEKRYQRFKVSISGGFDHANGVLTDSRPGAQF